MIPGSFLRDLYNDVLGPLLWYLLPSHMVVKSERSILAASSESALNNSALRLSCPGTFLFLRGLMAEIISSFSGVAVLTSRSCSASWMSASAVGGGLFRTWLKCSAQRASISASDVSSRPCLSVTGASVVP